MTAESPGFASKKAKGAALSSVARRVNLHVTSHLHTDVQKLQGSYCGRVCPDALRRHPRLSGDGQLTKDMKNEDIISDEEAAAIRSLRGTVRVRMISASLT